MSDNRAVSFRILGGPYDGLNDPSEADGWEHIATMTPGRFPPGFILTRAPKKRSQVLEKKPSTFKDALEASFAKLAGPPPGAQRYLYLLSKAETSDEEVRLTYTFAGPPNLEDSMEQARRAVEQSGEDEE